MKQSINHELDKVFSDIEKEYNEAVKLPFVNNPVAYAIYQVWKKYDVKPKVREVKK